MFWWIIITTILGWYLQVRLYIYIRKQQNYFGPYCKKQIKQCFKPRVQSHNSIHLNDERAQPNYTVAPSAVKKCTELKYISKRYFRMNCHFRSYYLFIAISAGAMVYLDYALWWPNSKLKTIWKVKVLNAIVTLQLAKNRVCHIIIVNR